MTDKTKLEQELARENLEKAPMRAWGILSHIAKEHGWEAIESLIDGKAEIVIGSTHNGTAIYRSHDKVVSYSQLDEIEKNATTKEGT